MPPQNDKKRTHPSGVPVNPVSFPPNTPGKMGSTASKMGRTASLTTNPFEKIDYPAGKITHPLNKAPGRVGKMGRLPPCFRQKDWRQENFSAIFLSPIFLSKSPPRQRPIPPPHSQVRVEKMRRLPPCFGQKDWRQEIFKAIFLSPIFLSKSPPRQRHSPAPLWHEEPAILRCAGAATGCRSSPFASPARCLPTAAHNRRAKTRGG